MSSKINDTYVAAQAQDREAVRRVMAKYRAARDLLTPPTEAQGPSKLAIRNAAKKESR